MCTAPHLFLIRSKPPGRKHRTVSASSLAARTTQCSRYSAAHDESVSLLVVLSNSGCPAVASVSLHNEPHDRIRWERRGIPVAEHERAGGAPPRRPGRRQSLSHVGSSRSGRVARCDGVHYDISAPRELSHGMGNVGCANEPPARWYVHPYVAEICPEVRLAGSDSSS